MLLLNILPQVTHLLSTQFMSTLIGHTNFFRYNIIMSSELFCTNHVIDYQKEETLLFVLF